MNVVEKLTTDDFWEKMCDAGFVRISLHRGKIMDNYYFVAVAPEEVDGFIDEKIACITKDLGLDKKWWEFWK